MNATPFPRDYRASGLLLHLTSLPSRYGSGDLGPTAEAWIDHLACAGQTWWQLLPLNVPGRNDSPYLPISTFAINPLLISPDRLVEEGLVRPSDCECPAFPEGHVDYRAVAGWKQRLLETAWESFQAEGDHVLRSLFDEFCEEHADWLRDFALFQAFTERQASESYLQWPREMVRRDPDAMRRAARELAGAIDRVQFVQFLAFRQLGRMRCYAQERGVRLLGDLPFFVSPNSADVWAHPELFQLDQQYRPRWLAGVPPDYFSEDGQLWGNPLYDWEALRNSDYGWWIDRLRGLLTHVDLIRLDHFRAFDAAWHVPAESETARVGEWLPGPGAEFFWHVRDALGGLPFVAEDLGLITDDVYDLRDAFGLPGMRVLQFAFDGDLRNPFLPENFLRNTVAFTGTHDNNTTRGWYRELPSDEQQLVRDGLPCDELHEEDAAWELIERVWSSAAALAAAPLQDVLNLGPEARMNVPGTVGGNWTWRCTPQMLADAPFERLRELTGRSGRLPTPR